MNKTELPVSLLLTVRARITNFSPVPNLGNCLKAGSEVDIVCKNIGFPVGRVEFIKDGSPVDLSTERCVCVCVRVCACVHVCTKITVNLSILSYAYSHSPTSEIGTLSFTEES